MPRVIAAREWRVLERACAQRVRAMNAFLDDLYHGARILEAGVIPRRLVYTSLQYRREMVGVEPPGGAWVGFDPTTGNAVDERYVRVAVGRELLGRRAGSRARQLRHPSGHGDPGRRARC